MRRRDGAPMTAEERRDTLLTIAAAVALLLLSPIAPPPLGLVLAGAALVLVFVA